jgi:hypothetical protein
MREKKAISWKEAREEAQKLRESAAVNNSNDDDDDDGKAQKTNGHAAASDSNRPVGGVTGFFFICETNVHVAADVICRGS